MTVDSNGNQTTMAYALIDRTGYVIMRVGTLGECWRMAHGLGNCAIARLEPSCWYVIARRVQNHEWVIG